MQYERNNIFFEFLTEIEIEQFCLITFQNLNELVFCFRNFNSGFLMALNLDFNLSARAFAKMLSGQWIGHPHMLKR